MSHGVISSEPVNHESASPCEVVKVDHEPGLISAVRVHIEIG